MSKSIKDVLTNTLNGTDAKLTEIGWERYGENIDQALKELEAIISDGQPQKKKIADGDTIGYLAYASGYNAAVDDFLRNLTALYGRED